MKLKWKIILIYLFLLVIGLWMKGCEADEIDEAIPFLITIESNGNPSAYNESTKCRGLLQISEIVLREWNTNENHQALETRDLYNKAVNITIGSWYLHRIKDHYLPHYGIPYNFDFVLIGYNFGVGGLNKWYKAGAKINKLPRETRNYLTRFHKLRGY